MLIAHYYVDGRIQDLAEATGGHVGDSLDMARFGHDHPVRTLLIAMDNHEIFIDHETGVRALVPLERMLAFKA